MNLTQVYLTPGDKAVEDLSILPAYQNQTTYIQLFIEDSLRKNKTDVGNFNRLVFEEGGDAAEDFHVVGHSAMPISLENTLELLQTLDDERERHNYFVGKFLEGFGKFDKHFHTSLKSYLTPLIAKQFYSDLSYEKKIFAKQFEKIRLQVWSRYTQQSYQVHVRTFHGRAQAASRIIFECEPDLFHTKFHANKVEASKGYIRLINKVREDTAKCRIENVT